MSRRYDGLECGHIAYEVQSALYHSAIVQRIQRCKGKSDICVVQLHMVS